MELYLSFDGDAIGQRAGQALLQDDIEGVRKISRSIEAGEDLWKNWATTAGGSVVSAGGDEGCVSIPVDKLSDVETIRNQYHDLVGATCSVGIGLKISEASKALMIAKLRGKDRVVLWSADMEAELEAARAQPQDEAAKLSEHYLTADLEKGDAQHNVGKFRGAHAGFSGHQKNGQPSKEQPKPSQGDHTDVQATVKAIEAGKQQTIAPEQTHAAQDFETSLHSAAQAQEKEDADSGIKDDIGLDQLKKQIVSTLAQVKMQMPAYVAMKQTAPEAYQTFMNLVSGVLALGKYVMKDQPPVDNTDPRHVEQELGKTEPTKTDDGHGTCPECGAMAGCDIDCKTCDEHSKSWNKDEMDASPATGAEVEKADGAKGGIPGKPSRQHLKLPVGSIHDGKIKVRHADQKVGWVEATSGMVTGQEDDAANTGMNSHPVSSRKPNAK